MTTPKTFAQAIKRIVELEEQNKALQEELAKVNDRENKRIVRYLFEKKSLELEQNTKDLEERVVKTIGPDSLKGTVKDAVAKARELWALRKTLPDKPLPTSSSNRAEDSDLSQCRWVSVSDSFPEKIGHYWCSFNGVQGEALFDGKQFTCQVEHWLDGVPPVPTKGDFDRITESTKGTI